MTQQSNTFIDSTKLTKWTKWFLYLQIAVTVIALISGVFEYQFLNDIKNSVYTSQAQAVAAAEASDSRQQMIGIIELAIYVVSGILILKWIHRANFNARQLGASEMEFTPGWSIGWYFVPFANLWKPYQAMKEIWKASISPQDWKNQTVPSLLGWWWFFWIVSNMLGNASFRMALRADQINELITANIVLQLSYVMDIPLNLIVLVMVTKIYEMQMAQYKHRI
ncbi:DUF4328 domain-containing protein [Stenoxybacter acetivorans]|uniref:DUF4328 domain-containing protein n=1 Tax=Stenoxybacter acetivorans TaxID=422441 RepID=UPI00055BF21E|nr:DUF4328 domain-containing protein [Stenoxybacter acetivorans]